MVSVLPPPAKIYTPAKVTIGEDFFGAAPTDVSSTPPIRPPRLGFHWCLLVAFVGVLLGVTFNAWADPGAYPMPVPYDPPAYPPAHAYGPGPAAYGPPGPPSDAAALVELVKYGGLPSVLGGIGLAMFYLGRSKGVPVTIALDDETKAILRDLTLVSRRNP